MNDLDQQIRDYYGSKSLSKDRLEAILKTAVEVKRPLWRRARIWGSASLIAAILTLAFILTWTNSATYINGQIAQSVVTNSSKQLKPEVFTDNWSSIQEALPKLDFQIEPTQLAQLSDYTIVGARYCSIQDELAAQITVSDNANNQFILYVAPLTETFAKSTPTSVICDDCEVTLWHDENRIFALVKRIT